MLTSQLKNTFALLLLAMCCYTNSVVGQNLLTPDSLRNKIVQLETKGDYNEISRLFKKYYETYTESQKWENLTQLEVLEVNILRRKNQFKKAQKFIHSTLEQANKTLDVNSKILALTYKTAGDLYVDDLRLFDQGLIYYQLCMSIEMEQDTGFNKDLVIAYNNLGVTFKLLGKFEEADSFHRKALELIPNDEQEFLRHSTLINLGETKFRVLEYDSAQYYLQKALDLWVASELPMVSKNLAFNYLSLAQVLTDKGDFDLAIELNLKALAIYQVVLDPDDVSLAELYMELSYVYQKKNNFTLAIQYTNQAADIFQKKYGKDHPDMASIHHSLGHIYYNQSQYFNAHLIEKSIEHYKELLRNDSINYPELDKPFVAVDFHAIGLAYKFSGNYKKALSYIKATFNLQRKIFGEESLRLINTINNIGAVYVDLKKYDSARFYFNQALFICKKKEQELPLDFINIHKNFADVFLFEEKYSEAINSINKSLQYFGIEPSANGEIELPPLDSIKFKNNLIYVLPRRAKALLGLYNKTKDPTYLDLTLNNDLQLTQIYIDIIQESNSSDGQLQQIPTLVETYENIIFCESELLKHTKNDRHAELAFTLAEKGKAILLMSRIKENESKLIYDIPEGSQTKADSLRKKINALSTQISLTNISSSDQTNKQSGDRKKLLSTQQKYYEVISQIQVDYPGYNSRILDFQVDLSKIQSSLSTNTALIEYVVAKEYIYLFYVTADQLELKVLENPIELEQYAAEFINAILTRNIEDYADRAYKLYDHLIKPYDQLLSKAKIDYLTIVSDGFLSYLPFEAFLKSSPNKLDYKSFDYLMRHFNISYDYSASLKIQLAKQKLSDRSNVLAFAPTFSGKSSNIATRNASTMSELPYAQQEAENVVAQFNGVRYTGDMATETTFKKEAHNYQILHLATHALADDQQPNLSRLFFADNDTLNDGLLYAHELYNMDLNAKLVTLSACNTGTGKFYKGEGIASLARAFRYAGCQNVIMSLWAVADQSTSDIMDEFYSQSVQGLPMSDALHAAKLHYLENADGNTADPFYWAGFTLIGQNKPLKQSSVNLEIVISIISLFVIVLILIGIRKKKKRNLNIEKG